MSNKQIVYLHPRFINLRSQGHFLKNILFHLSIYFKQKGKKILGEKILRNNNYRCVE